MVGVECTSLRGLLFDAPAGIAAQARDCCRLRDSSDLVQTPALCRVAHGQGGR